MSLPGVTLARVEVRPTGEIVGIHLMVAAGVDTGSLINTVDETLRTTFDLKISPEQIFVAHVNARSARPRSPGRRTARLPSIDRIDCPIGLPGITGKEPAVIAIAVAAALVPRLQPAQAGVPDRKLSEGLVRRDDG